MYYNSSIHFFTIIIITYYRIMTVRKIIREWGGVERGRTPSQQGRAAPQRACPTWPSLPQQEHMNSDALIIGFNFEP